MEIFPTGLLELGPDIDIEKKTDIRPYHEYRVLRVVTLPYRTCGVTENNRRALRYLTTVTTQGPIRTDKYFFNRILNYSRVK